MRDEGSARREPTGYKVRRALARRQPRPSPRSIREKRTTCRLPLTGNAPYKGAPRLRRGQEGQGQEAAPRGRHLGLAARRDRPRRRRPGRGRRRRSPQAPEAALPVAEGGVRRRGLRPARGPARLLPARADADRRPPPRRDRGLRPPPASLGGGADARLARPLAPPRRGLRGAARGLRDRGQAGHDPPHAAPPRPPEPQAATRSLTSQTASELFSGSPPRNFPETPIESLYRGFG